MTYIELGLLSCILVCFIANIGISVCLYRKINNDVKQRDIIISNCNQELISVRRRLNEKLDTFDEVETMSRNNTEKLSKVIDTLYLIALNDLSKNGKIPSDDFLRAYRYNGVYYIVDYFDRKIKEER